MSNASLIAALDSARADEVLERASMVIVAQDKIIAALAQELKAANAALARAGLKAPDVRAPAQEAAEQAFIRAGHKPEDRTCDHKHWTFGKHGRACTCGTFMMDWGD